MGLVNDHKNFAMEKTNAENLGPEVFSWTFVVRKGEDRHLTTEKEKCLSHSLPHEKTTFK